MTTPMCSTQQAGRIVYINNAQIATANIPAGKAVLHLVRPVVATGNYQDVLDALIGFQAPSPTPITLWQAGMDDSIVQAAAVPDEAATINMQQAVTGGSAADASQLPPLTAQEDGGDDDDDAMVNYSFEQDFQHAEQAASSTATAPQPSVPDFIVSDDNVGVPRPDALSRAEANAVHMPALLLVAGCILAFGLL